MEEKKKSIRNKNSLEIMEELKQATWENQRPLFNFSGKEEKVVELRPNSKLPPAQFVPATEKTKIISLTPQPAIYYAHPDTIAALRKDIFVTDENLLDFEELLTCPSCRQELDLQFWRFCPFCQNPLKV